jgi:hypothetical protein
LTTSVHEAEKLSLDQIEAFLNAGEEIQFEGENRQQVYGWVEQVLRQQQYSKQGRKARGLVRRYLEKMTGLSRAQVTRLIARYQVQHDGARHHQGRKSPSCWIAQLNARRLDPVAEFARLPDHHRSACSFRPFDHRWASFLVVDPVMQNQPNEPTKRWAIAPMAGLCPMRGTCRRYTISKMLPLYLTAAWAA